MISKSLENRWRKKNDTEERKRERVDGRIYANFLPNTRINEVTGNTGPEINGALVKTS